MDSEYFCEVFWFWFSLFFKISMCYFQNEKQYLKRKYHYVIKIIKYDLEMCYENTPLHNKHKINTVVPWFVNTSVGKQFGLQTKAFSKILFLFANCIRWWTWLWPTASINTNVDIFSRLVAWIKFVKWSITAKLC